MPNAAFLQELTTIVEQQQATVAANWPALPNAALMAQPGPGRWSALECIEHLNRYSSYYNPALKAALERVMPATNVDAVAEPLRYSWLGHKSVELVRPTNARAHKTLSRMNPSSAAQPTREVLREFIGHQTQLLQLLNRASGANLNWRAVPVEFFKLLKLRLGETFEFVVQHQERHLRQAEQAIKQGTEAAKIPQQTT